MSIRDVLLEIKRISTENGLSEPFVVGGLPRDKFLDRARMVKDIDITTGDESVKKLAVLVANRYQAHPIQFEDGHHQVVIGQVRFDFSSNFNSPDIEYFLNRAGVKDPTPMQQELFSRDFTCNTLIVPMNLRSLSDPTGLGINDIKNKILRTPLPPRITMRDDPRRVIRSIYLATKLGFEVEQGIVDWALKNQAAIHKASKPMYSKGKLADATRADVEKTIRLMTEMNLWHVVSIPKILEDAYFQRGVVK